MDIDDELGRVRRLSDEELLARLSGLLGSSRKLVTLVVAHLGEVEERRLHLLAGYESMFAYCTRRLGMSEDEACRRIEVARLARRFPSLFERLASGRISLSVAALVKTHLTESNHAALLDDVCGMTVRQAREVLAKWFPQPDVAPSIRKLPERRDAGRATNAASTGDSAPALFASPLLTWASDGSEAARSRAATHALAGSDAHADASLTSDAESGDAPGAGARSNAPVRTTAPSVAATVEAPSASVCSDAAPKAPKCRDSAPSPSARLTRAPSTIQPLSPARYKVVFTADAELERKLELARDLLRHAVPSGDLAALVERALDLLIEMTLKRRFAQRSGGKAARSRQRPDSITTLADAADGARLRETTDASVLICADDDVPAIRDGAASEACPDAHDCATLVEQSERSPRVIDALECPARVETAPRASRSRHLPNAVRRAVLERDGLRCTWQSPDGTCCESRAWLEHDHVVPRGLGGTDDPANIRICCRAHNRLAAELAYGQAAMARIIARRRGGASQTTDRDGAPMTRQVRRT